MKKVSRNEILRTISKNELKSWQTKTGKQFTCQIWGNYIEITNSKEKVRRVTNAKIDEFCEKYNRIFSSKISDYKDISFDASYLLTFINSYLHGELFDSEPNYFSILNNTQNSLPRSKIYQQLGVSLRNNQWAWGGLSDDRSFVVFTIWVDAIGNNRLIELFNPIWETKGHGLSEQKRLIEFAFNNDLKVYGLLAEAKETSAKKRRTKRVEQNDLLELNLIREGEVVKAKIISRFPMSYLSEKAGIKSTAIDDLDQDAIGNDSPNKASSMVAFYQRDPKVRKKVLQLANGKCEYCGLEGFLKPNGNRYIETHHIIALSNEGKDKISNVIALCPEHHKEAHFGVNSEKLELRFLDIVKSRLG